MADEYFLGMRATGDLVTNEREQSWRRGILRLFPNGSAPLTALTNLMPSESLPDYYHHWFDKTLTTQRADVTHIYNDASLTNLYTTGAVAGDVKYVKMAAADTKMFRVGHEMLLRDASDYTEDCVGKVVAVGYNGASSYIAVQLLEDDDNSTASHTLANADTVLVIGNINPQAGTRPTAISQGPSEHSNYTQIWRTSLEIARTLRKTKLRTGDPYLEVKRDALELHSIEMEKSFLWGIKTLNTGDNGKPEHTTEGIIRSIIANGTVQDFVTDSGTAYSGKTWDQAGVKWINEHLEEIFRYGSTERLAFCGSGALLGIQDLIMNFGMYTLTPDMTSFGLSILRWTTPFGDIYLKTHPLFSYEATNRNIMVLFEPRNLHYRYIDDTYFKPDNSEKTGGGTGIDGSQEEFLTEAMIEFHFPITGGFLAGVGQDNPGA